jgi:3',5'-cyclic-AMP phosphodiesterase
MNPSVSSRRNFLKLSGTAVATSAMPLRWVRADEVSLGSKLKLRFAVASDLHYGQRNTPFDKMAGELVEWINKEKQGKGLDAFFVNGDLVNDTAPGLVTLRDQFFSKLKVPYYCIKGNHDYVDGTPDSPSESWDKVWGYPSNHTVKIGDYVFVMADTSAPAKSNIYLAADREWLKGQFEAHQAAPSIFVMIHIQQRKHKVDGWPQHGVSAVDEVPKAEAVMKLLESTPNVRAVFHGHNHSETGVYVSGERRYFFDSHAGGSWGAKRGYRIVEVYDDGKAVTYQMNAEDDGEISRHELDAPA